MTDACVLGPLDRFGVRDDKLNPNGAVAIGRGVALVLENSTSGKPCR